MREGLPAKADEAGVRRVAIASGAERQNLPDVLLGGGQKIDERMRRRAQIADAAIGGQRGNVQQNAGGTLKLHMFLLSDGRRMDGGTQGDAIKGYNP